MKTLHSAVVVVATAVAVPVVAASPAVAARAQTSENKITIDVMNADVVNVIRLIGDVSRKNIVVADEVKGRVTLKLKNVGWRAALDVVLKASGAAVVEEGDILWIAPAERVRAAELAELDLAAERELRGPLYTRVLQVNNARAADMAALVKGLLSPRGTVTFDERTNVLIVRDIKGSVALHHAF